MTATNQFGASGRQYPVSDHLFFKLQGPSTNSISETAKIVKEVVERHGGKGWRMAKNDSEGGGDVDG